ncbi:hypothetical protein DPMN_135964 [Dreissena polymorpha]|uniref:Uncharacterized protein n=1 Tax=Dreissena polymorpha TaxID=45954 RepID=A0A9D4JG94_DREPO|nr:hypothetical protein DPMN_135964 [Dreissena polymorpha]
MLSFQDVDMQNIGISGSRVDRPQSSLLTSKKLYSCQDNLLWEVMKQRWKSVSLNNHAINSNKLKNKGETDVRKDVSAERQMTGPVNTDRWPEPLVKDGWGKKSRQAELSHSQET